MKVLLVGHVTNDIINGKLVQGGPPNYQLPVFHSNNFEVTILTSYDEHYHYDPKSSHTIVVGSKETTTFQFSFEIDSQNNITRTMRLLSKASDLIYYKFQDDLDDYYDIIIVSPVAREVDLQTLKNLAIHTSFLAADLQGFSRIWDESGLISDEFNHNVLSEIISSVNLIKASASELSLSRLNEFQIDNIDILITKSSEGVEMYTKGKTIRFNAIPVSDIIDDTGAGDIFLAAFLVAITQSSVQDALQYASQIAQLSLGILGVPDSKDIPPFKV